MVHSEGSHQAPTATMHKGNVFVFRNCRFSVGSGVKRKAILKGVSGEVHSGGVLAIMGPSGAGKTTLLNVLSLVPIGGLAEGEVCFNGRPVAIPFPPTNCHQPGLFFWQSKVGVSQHCSVRAVTVSDSDAGTLACRNHSSPLSF